MLAKLTRISDVWHTLSTDTSRIYDMTAQLLAGVEGVSQSGLSSCSTGTHRTGTQATYPDNVDTGPQAQHCQRALY